MEIKFMKNTILLLTMFFIGCSSNNTNKLNNVNSASKRNMEYTIANNIRLQVVNIDGQDYICLYNFYDRGGVAIIKHGEKCLTK